MSDPILVVDDEQPVLQSVRRTLRTNGIEEVLICSDPLSVMPLIDAAHPEVPVIVVTAEQDARTAVDCMKAGAYDYLLKPASIEQLMATIRRALDYRELREENSRLRATLLDESMVRPEAFSSIL